MTETEGFPPDPGAAPEGPAAVIGVLTAEADLTVTPAPEPAQDGAGG